MDSKTFLKMQFGTEQGSPAELQPALHFVVKTFIISVHFDLLFHSPTYLRRVALIDFIRLQLMPFISGSTEYPTVFLFSVLIPSITDNKATQGKDNCTEISAACRYFIE